MPAEDTGDIQIGEGVGDSGAFEGSFSRTHADQYPYNSRAMLAQLVRLLLGIQSGMTPTDPQEELKINGLKADPKLPAKFFTDPDLSALAIRPKAVPYPPGNAPYPRIPYGTPTRGR